MHKARKDERIDPVVVEFPYLHLPTLVWHGNDYRYLLILVKNLKRRRAESDLQTPFLDRRWLFASR
jgi:hypothetical protein